MISLLLAVIVAGTPAPRVKPTRVPSPPPYVLLCRSKADKLCRVYRLGKDGHYTALPMGTPLVGMPPRG